MDRSILSSQVSPTTYQDATHMILTWAKAVESRAIFAANVHMVMLAHDDPNFQKVVNSADIVTPDGMPLVWALRQKGYKDQQRVYGPTLMLKVCEAASEEGVSIGLLGGTKEMLRDLETNLHRKFPELKIKFRFSPPFRELTSDEDAQLVAQIRQSGIQILFVGLGCPKQEIWINHYLGEIPAVMIGVGAAFAFHAGKVKQAPAWMQRIGLEWLFRLSQEPARLWKRYLFTNPRFLLLELVELVKEHGIKAEGN